MCACSRRFRRRPATLSEALTYQTGSGKVLSVIASSPTDVEPVLKTIVESACELCDAYDAVVRLKVGDDLRCQRSSRPDTGRHEEVARSTVTGLQDARSSIRSRCMCTTCSPLKATNFTESPGNCTLPGPSHRFECPVAARGRSVGVIILRRTKCSRSATSRSTCCRPLPTRR